MDAFFLGERPRQTEIKHRILDHYLQIWVYHLHKHHELAFIDACAGTGRYEVDGTPGSPVIAARYNDRPDVESKGVRLLVHACEPKASHCAALRLALRSWTERIPPVAFIYPVPFENVLADILEETCGNPTLLFVDPYGLKGVAPDQLSPFLGDKDRTRAEIIVRVPPQFFGRWAGWVHRAGADDRWGKMARTFLAKLEGMGIDTEALKQNARAGQGDWLTLFGEYLDLFEKRFRYVQALPVRAAHTQEPKYYLVHGTDSPHGAAYFCDVCASAEDWLYERHEKAKAGDQMDIFGGPPAKRPAWIESLEPTIKAALSEGSRSWIEVRAELALEHGSRFDAKSHRAAARMLHERKEIEWNPVGSLLDGSICNLPGLRRPRLA